MADRKRTVRDQHHRSLRAISLFSGAGGLDHGMEAAGLRITVAVESDELCCQSLRKSLPDVSIINRDISCVSTREMLQAAGLLPGEADLLIGGPPCQPFSKAGYWNRGDALRLADPRARTLSAFLRVLEESLPSAFLLENVDGIAYEGKDEGLQLILEQIDRINRRTKSRYLPFVKKLNAAHYGVPQLRERLFVIASRDGTPFYFPQATHSEDGRGGLEAYTTAWDALADVGPMHGEDLAIRGKWAKLLPSIPEGENYLFHTERGEGRPIFGWRRRFWTFLLKLAKDRPSWTLQAQPGPSVGPFHWDNRRLGSREMARLQTFPDEAAIVGGRCAVQRQIGNAVPSLLAEVLAREIRVQLFGESNSTSGPRLMPTRHRPIPPKVRVREVPREYLHLVGNHSPHPGTGMGFGASGRRPKAPAKAASE